MYADVIWDLKKIYVSETKYRKYQQNSNKEIAVLETMWKGENVLTSLAPLARIFKDFSQWQDSLKFTNSIPT